MTGGHIRWPEETFCEERENDAFPFPQDIYGSRKVPPGLFATLSMLYQIKCHEMKERARRNSEVVPEPGAKS
jgi:hypothetical protein